MPRPPITVTAAGELEALRAEVAELREWKLHAETHMEREEKLADREKEKLLEARHAADSAAFTERAAIVNYLRATTNLAVSHDTWAPAWRAAANEIESCEHHADPVPR